MSTIAPSRRLRKGEGGKKKPRPKRGRVGHAGNGGRLAFSLRRKSLANGAGLTRRCGNRLARLDHGGDVRGGSVGDAGGKANADDQRRENERHHHHLEVGHAVCGKQREIVHDTIPEDFPVISRGGPVEGSRPCPDHRMNRQQKTAPQSRTRTNCGCTWLVSSWQESYFWVPFLDSGPIIEEAKESFDDYRPTAGGGGGSVPDPVN